MKSTTLQLAIGRPSMSIIVSAAWELRLSASQTRQARRSSVRQWRALHLDDSEPAWAGCRRRTVPTTRNTEVGNNASVPVFKSVSVTFLTCTNFAYVIRPLKLETWNIRRRTPTQGKEVNTFATVIRIAVLLQFWCALYYYK
jgi:hypothetical protein